MASRLPDLSSQHTHGVVDDEPVGHAVEIGKRFPVGTHLPIAIPLLQGGVVARLPLDHSHRTGADGMAQVLVSPLSAAALEIM